MRVTRLVGAAASSESSRDFCGGPSVNRGRSFSPHGKKPDVGELPGKAQGVKVNNTCL